MVKKPWDNEKSRALRSLTMQMTRLNRADVGRGPGQMSPETADRKRAGIEGARKEIYAVPRDQFTRKDRLKIFERWKLTVEDTLAEKRQERDG